MSPTIGTAVNMALELMIQAQKISTLILAAQTRGDTHLAPEEWKALLDDRKAAFDRLNESIATAQAEGR